MGYGHGINTLYMDYGFTDYSNTNYYFIQRMIHQEDIEKLIIAETDLWEDISDDGDGDYDEGTLVLSEEGEVVRDLVNYYWAKDPIASCFTASSTDDSSTGFTR
jgi:hypothetical protein